MAKIESQIEDLLTSMLGALSLGFKKMSIKEDKEAKSFRINIDSDDPSMIIGYHGENIYAFQHLVKTILWKQSETCDFNIVLDVDEYRKRQEDNVMNLAERRVEIARNTNTDQKLPPMSAYFRRVVHMHLTKPEFEDIETESTGEDDRRQVIIRVK